MAEIWRSVEKERRPDDAPMGEICSSAEEERRLDDAPTRAIQLWALRVRPRRQPMGGRQYVLSRYQAPMVSIDTGAPMANPWTKSTPICLNFSIASKLSTDSATTFFPITCPMSVIDRTIS